MYLCDSCGVRENREIKRKERVMHDSIARSASASGTVKERRRTPRGVSPLELTKLWIGLTLAVVASNRKGWMHVVCGHGG